MPLLTSEDTREPFLRDGLVWRSRRPWSEAVQELLTHIQAQGFDAAPAAGGFTGQWERVSFVEGRVAEIETDAEMQSEPVLVSAAVLLRRLHDCTAAIAADWAGRVWQLPPRVPFETICHGDFAPYNVVLRDGVVAGIIDFETAHPAPRSWDLAYALYRWAPLSQHAAAPLADIDAQIARARRFLDAYGLANRERAAIVDAVTERLRSLLDFMKQQADAGSTKYSDDLLEGDGRLYEADIAYLARHREALLVGLLRR